MQPIKPKCFGTPQYTNGSSICAKCYYEKPCWEIVQVKYKNHKKYFYLTGKEIVGRKPKKNNEDHICICGHTHQGDEGFRKICYDLSCICIVFRKKSNYKTSRAVKKK